MESVEFPVQACDEPDVRYTCMWDGKVWLVTAIDGESVDPFVLECCDDESTYAVGYRELHELLAPSPPVR
jgi:hypothetical protein